MRSAAADSLEPLFNPKSIAIIGASDNAMKFGGRPIRYMQETGYKGRIYPVNPKGGKIQGLQAYQSIGAVPDEVDLAIIAVPAPQVLQAVREAAEAAVRSVVIFSSGFAEIDAQGRQWQAQIEEIAAQYPIRIVGPNCMGMLNCQSSAIGTFTTAFEHGYPKPGRVTIVSQSGAVGSHTLVLARERGLGMKGWVTTGNECDVSVADCLAYAAEDPETDVILVYMEGCRNPALFIEALRTAHSREKPVVVLKVGASEVGAQAAGTHTASLAGSDDVFAAMFKQFGAYRVSSLAQLLDLGIACSAGILPPGRRLGIVTISGGVGVLASDWAARCGLEVPALSDSAQQQLKSVMPFAAVRNPVDTSAQVLNDVDLLRQNLQIILHHKACDAYLIFLSATGFSARIMAELQRILPEIRAEFPDALMLLSMMCRAEDEAFFAAHRYIVIEDPSRAITAIAALADIAEAFQRPLGLPPAAAKLAAPAEPVDKVMNESQAASLLQQAGLPIIAHHHATSADEAVAAAEAFGYPVVMKILSSDIQHKSDVGGVRLDLRDQAAVAAAYRQMHDQVERTRPDAQIDGVLVMPMQTGGLECIIGSFTDAVFGPVVLFGLGGIWVEQLKDTSLRIAPFDSAEARRMIMEVKAASLLTGARGRPALDIPALADCLAQLSVFAYQNRQAIDSIDLNPVLVRPQGSGVVALDALIVGQRPS